MNILNQQFQSVFTHDPPHDIPDKGPSPHPIMEQIHINDKGVLFESRCFIILLIIICSISLQQMHVSDIGL
jgi:hypothetical protein